MTDRPELLDVDVEVLDRLVELAKEDGEATVLFDQLLVGRHSPDKVKESLSRLVALKYVNTLRTFGLGPRGRELREQRLADQAAEEAELERATELEQEAGAA